MSDEQMQLDWRSVDFSKYKNTTWHPGRCKLSILLWRCTGMWMIKHLPCCCETYGERFFNNIRLFLLRLFGARVGSGVVVRACEIYFPWNLDIANNVWLGFECKLYSLVRIKLGNNTCISQRAFLCTGSHSPTDPTFSLVVGEITLADAAWVAADCFVCPGVTLNEGAVAAAGSIVTRDLPAMTICGGNPCKPIKPRVLTAPEQTAGDTVGPANND